MTLMDRTAGGNGHGDARQETGSFEDEFLLVEGAVEALERGNLPLEESLREYERGLRALRACYEILRGAQKRIEVLAEEVGCVSEHDGAPGWKPAASIPAIREAVEQLEAELPGDPGSAG